MNNWQCAGDVPTDAWRGQMTMPRRLSLLTTEAGVVLRRSADGAVGTKVGVRRDGTLVIDRTRSGDVAFNPLFPSVEEAPVTVRDGEVTFTTYLDRSSVEVLAEGGQVSVTDFIYPRASATGVAAYAVGGTAKAVDTKVTPIRP